MVGPCHAGRPIATLLVASLWQIVTVAVERLRLENSYVPLVVRAALLLVPPVEYAIVGLSFDGQAPGEPLSPPGIVLPALLLVLVAAVASLPVPARIPAYLLPIAETVAAAIVISTTGAGGLLFLPYLVMPLLTAGLVTGAGVALGCACLASVVVLVPLIASGEQAGREQLVQTGLWIPLFAGVAVLGAWIRRIRTSAENGGEPAYADAHRLLSELHVVARQLSLGLDPPTLAAALVDDVSAVVRQGSAGVLVRSPSGRLVPLVGPVPPPNAEAVIEAAGETGEIQSLPGQSGDHIAALPVRMGERVVAVVLLRSQVPLTDAILQRCTAVIDQSGPRMASAMLFDDVRRLASFDERMRLAREIHDGIAQDLASVGYLLDDIRSDVDEEAAGKVRAVREQLRTMVTDLRLSIFDLRAGVDDTVGLGTALTEYVQRVGSQFGLTVHLSMGESPHRLPIATEVELLRMAQEAVTNVRRHSGAQNLWLTLTVAPPMAKITVADDGTGMRSGRPDSMGISGMHERAVRIGARLRIGARAQGGTLVEISLNDPKATNSDSSPPSPHAREEPDGYAPLHGERGPSTPSAWADPGPADHAEQEALP